MPWDELKARKFPAFEKDLDGISRQTMEDHYKLYEGPAAAPSRGGQGGGRPQ
jgi:hypothetical protein